MAALTLSRQSRGLVIATGMWQLQLSRVHVIDPPRDTYERSRGACISFLENPMGKAKKDRSGDLFKETEEIAALLAKESEQDLVILAVPSHDKNNEPLPDALIGEWASNAMKLMADLYQGATSYAANKGIYKTSERHYLWDKPLIIESFGRIETIQDPQNLNLLVDFAKRMGKTLDQASVMLVFGTIMYYVENYDGV